MTYVSKPALVSLSAVLLIATACGSAVPAGQGIRGLVLLGPNCPVEQEGVPCPDTPYQVQLAVTNLEGTLVIKSFWSSADGTFQVALPVGEYAIRSTEQGGLPYCTTNQPVVVNAGEISEIIVMCDTGIR